MNFSSSRTVVAALVAAVVVIGCGSSTPASSLVQPPAFNPEGQTKCGVTKSQSRPLIVEWPAADRAALESQARRGLVVVRHAGCELEVLRQCKARGTYGYMSLTPKAEGVKISNEDDLYANIPVHAAKFEAQLRRSGELNVNMNIVGMYEAQIGSAPLSLEGDCTGATHVVTALAVGAFEFFAGSDATVGGGVTVLGAGAGARSQASRETLSRDGDAQSCGKAKREDTEPPQGCGALLRLELAPVGASLLPTTAAVAPVVAVASAVASAVAATPPTARACPQGQRLEGSECKPVSQKLATIAPEDEGFVDARGGRDWGDRCVVHYRAKRFANARAACRKALDMTPPPDVRGAILYNLALVENADNDSPLACDYLKQSLEVRPGATAVRKKHDELCAAPAAGH